MKTPQQQIIGSWKLNNFELKNLTVDKSIFPYGKEPIGILIFGADGFMSVSVMSDNRINFEVESLQMSSAEEKISAIDTYLSYAGKWKIENDRIYVEVITSLLPNWKDKEHYRTFQLNDKTLSFQTPKMKQGDFDILVELDWVKF
tara:strand:- start:5656 stop:6090 length:435 start_codon:yes stop_codon:yes gene_type:complete